MRMLLIRHGQSLGNIEARIQGDDDPLTDRGRSQARALAAALAARGDVGSLYASPLARAWETAEIIGTTVGLAPTREPGLAEINAGIAPGQRWADWTIANPDLAAAMAPDRQSLAAWPGGESEQVFSGRVFAAFDRVVSAHAHTDDVVALVAHGGSLAWITARLLGDRLDRWPQQRATLANCSISELALSADGQFAFASWNEVAHLAALDAPEG
ncbi:MAG: histidine phosphatase family protein [Thermomicrobiales bacterium]